MQQFIIKLAIVTLFASLLVIGYFWGCAVVEATL